MSPLVQMGIQGALVVLVVLIIPCAYRVWMGPAAADRLQAIDTITTLLIGIIIVLALLQGVGMFMDVAIGTPVIKPKESPCVLCNGLLCIEACKDGALKPVDTVTQVKMGIARINKSQCFAWDDQDCHLCYIKCPLQDEALYQEDGKPVINEEKCVGCGICEYVCSTINSTCAIKTLPQG